MAINNSECVLLKFRKNELKVGYRVWIKGIDKNEKVSESWLDEMIRKKQSVTVKWPDCHVESAARMKTKLKRCGWTRRRAKIIAHGEWIQMSEARDNWRKFSNIHFSKSERKSRRKKFDYSKFEDPFEHENPYPKKNQMVHLVRKKAKTLLKATLINSNFKKIRFQIKSNSLNESLESLKLITEDPDHIEYVRQPQPMTKMSCIEKIYLKKPGNDRVFKSIKFKSAYKCDVCKRTRTRKRDMKKHILEKHGQIFS